MCSLFPGTIWPNLQIETSPHGRLAAKYIGWKPKESMVISLCGSDLFYSFAGGRE